MSCYLYNQRGIAVRSVDTETSIRQIVRSSVEAYAQGFEVRHLEEADNPNGVINMKIHNVFIATLGEEIQYYTALARSLDSSMGNMLEKMAIHIANLFFDVSQSVTGNLYPEQINKIAELLEAYKDNNNSLKPSTSHYADIQILGSSSNAQSKRHISDYYLFDSKTNTHYLIELKIGGDLDNKKARSEKEALFEQYAILTNKLGSNAKVKCYFATAYNKFGENKIWKQGRVLQFFAEDELLIGKDFWNFICCSDEGYNIVIDEYKKSSSVIKQALERIKNEYLTD